VSEQAANGRYENGRRFRLYEIILGVVLAALFTLLFTSIQRLDNRISELERKVDENTRILVKMQTTLDLIASGLNIRVEPKEQAGPATTPAPGEKLATRDP